MPARIAAGANCTARSACGNAWYNAPRLFSCGEENRLATERKLFGSMEAYMKFLAIIAAFAVFSSAAIAQTTAPTAPKAATPAPVATSPAAPVTCKAQSSERKLAGAALKSFMTKCQTDAGTACTKSAADKKLTGAAKSSFTKKCTTEAVGV